MADLEAQMSLTLDLVVERLRLVFPRVRGEVAAGPEDGWWSFTFVDDEDGWATRTETRQPLETLRHLDEIVMRGRYASIVADWRRSRAPTS